MPEYIRLPGRPNGLLVNDLDTNNAKHHGLWKVSHVYDETPAVISDLAFAPRRDAEMAKAAIEGEADWTGSARGAFWSSSDAGPPSSTAIFSSSARSSSLGAPRLSNISVTNVPREVSAMFSKVKSSEPNTEPANHGK